MNCEPPRTETKTAKNSHSPSGSPSVNLAHATHSARNSDGDGRPFTPPPLARWQSGRDLLLLGLRMPCLVAATPITRGRGAKARSRYAGRVRLYATAGKRQSGASGRAERGRSGRGELCSRAAGRQAVRKASIDPSCHSGSASRSSRNLRYCTSCSGSLALSR